MGPATEAARFYCVTDDRYFLGAVGLVNSLRLVGHREPIHVLDCGLTETQRALLAPHAELTTVADDTPPWLLKTVAPLRHPADVMILIDADMIVTRPLTELIDRAVAGSVLAVENDRDRFMPEWGDLLGLGAVRRQTYVSSGLVAVGRELGTEILELMSRLQDKIDFDRTFWRRNEPDYPFLYGDQDVLNAILCARVPPERFEALPHRLAPTPPFGKLRVSDPERLRCAYPDGTEPFLVHHFATKPWLEPTHHGVYSQLLRRCLRGRDVPIRFADSELPLRFRGGARAYASRKRVDAIETFRWHILEPVRRRREERRGEPTQ